MLAASAATPWYDGPSLLAHLEAVDVSRAAGTRGFRLPVQWVCRPNSNFRGLARTPVAGPVAVGDELEVLPSGQHSTVEALLPAALDLGRAIQGPSLPLLPPDDDHARRATPFP